MEADEAGTVATIKSQRRELWTPIPVTSHLGLVGAKPNRDRPAEAQITQECHGPRARLSGIIGAVPGADLGTRGDHRARRIRQQINSVTNI